MKCSPDFLENGIFLLPGAQYPEAETCPVVNRDLVPRVMLQTDLIYSYAGATSTLHGNLVWTDIAAGCPVIGVARNTAAFRSALLGKTRDSMGYLYILSSWTYITNWICQLCGLVYRCCECTVLDLRRWYAKAGHGVMICYARATTIKHLCIDLTN